MNLKDFLKLAGQQGKVVVVGDDGSVKGVFLPFDEYQKLSGGPSQEKVQEDITEKVNREILLAQLEEVISSADGGTGKPMLQTPPPGMPAEEFAPLERIDSILNSRAADLFKSMPHNPNASPYTFTGQPDITTSASDEEIKPNFDDI
jgi:hypothetical protein